MAQRRWLAPWKDRAGKPAIYHVINRVVDRRFVFGQEEKEKFCMFMRMIENFSGCKVLSYCVMSNHFHVLLEVPPQVIGMVTKDGRELRFEVDEKAKDEDLQVGQQVKGVLLEESEFYRRLQVLYSDAVIAEIEAEVRRARERGNEKEEARIFHRYAYRMQSLSEFMKNMTQRFTRWFNRTHDRSGRLWEERFKSVIVEDGIAARTMAAYIDLNPVRAGIVKDPAEYRWSTYGEAVAGGKKARAGLVKTLRTSNIERPTSKNEVKSLVRAWAQGGMGKEYRRVFLGEGGGESFDRERTRLNSPHREPNRMSAFSF